MSIMNLFELFALLVLIGFLARLGIYLGGFKGIKEMLSNGDD